MAVSCHLTLVLHNQFSILCHELKGGLDGRRGCFQVMKLHWISLRWASRIIRWKRNAAAYQNYA